MTRPRAFHARPSCISGLAAVAALIVTAGSVHGQVFQSVHSANLPTTETLREGNWLFEISHRFVPPIEGGSEALWGLDGPVINRLGMAWSPVDGALVGFQRTNLDDNFELYGKKRLLDGALNDGPMAVAAMAGIAWNTDVVEIEGAEANEMQAYAQLIANVLLADGAVAIGIVPSWVHNPRLRDTESSNAVAVGVNGQWYFAEGKSLLGEWVFSEQIQGAEHDSGAFGFGIETRGHSFKFVLTNQTRANPTQVLAGSANPFDLDQLRLGFNITRLLPF